MLPATFVEPLRNHLSGVRAMHERDLAQGAGRVTLPDALGRKYPNAIRYGDGYFRQPLAILTARPGFRAGIICMRA